MKIRNGQVWKSIGADSTYLPWALSLVQLRRGHPAHTAETAEIGQKAGVGIAGRSP